jgi:hypothetical protein
VDSRCLVRALRPSPIIGEFIFVTQLQFALPVPVLAKVIYDGRYVSSQYTCPSKKWRVAQSSCRDMLYIANLGNCAREVVQPLCTFVES